MSLFSVPNKPDCLEWDDWDQWEKEAARKYPIRYFLSERLPILWARAWRRFIHDPWYWLKCTVWYRWNVVVIPTLPPTYCDPDERLLHAAFEILRAYIEDEQPSHAKQTWQEVYDAYAFGESDNEHARQRADECMEINALYHWWKVERPARVCPFEDIPDNASMTQKNEHNEMLRAAYEEERRMREEDDQKLIRLVTLRGHYWT